MFQDQNQFSQNNKGPKADQAIVNYQQALGWLDSNQTDDAETEALETLIRRDNLADIWQSLSNDQRATVEKLDNNLRSKKNIFSRELFPFSGKDPDRWWWTFYA